MRITSLTIDDADGMRAQAHDFGTFCQVTLGTPRWTGSQSFAEGINFQFSGPGAFELAERIAQAWNDAVDLRAADATAVKRAAQ